MDDPHGETTDQEGGNGEQIGEVESCAMTCVCGRIIEVDITRIGEDKFTFQLTIMRRPEGRA